MRANNTRPVYLLILLLGVILNLIVIRFFHERNESREHQAARRTSEAFLEKMYASFRFEKVFDKEYGTLFTSVAGKTASEAASLGRLWLHSHNMASDACEIVYFSDKVPLNVSAESSEDWKFMLSRFDTGLIRPRLEGATKNRMIKLLNGGVGFPRLEGKPGVIQQVTIAKDRTYGIWFSDPEKYKTGINAMIVLIHARKLTDRLIAENLFARLGVAKSEFGYVNLFNPEDSLVPNGLNPYVIAPRVSGMDIKSGCEYLTFGDREILVLFKPDGRILLTVMNYKELPAPFWSLSLFFFWLPLWFRARQTEQTGLRLSLTSLISFVFVISMALPVLAVGFYWNLFIDSRRESAKIETASRLEKLLIQLDANFTEDFRIIRKKYVDLVSILNKDNSDLQTFIDQSIRLELQFLFDTCLLIDSEGRFVRPYAASGMQVRRLVFYDMAHR
ncbi:MAG: hypothetical protein ACD_39C02112G0002, partial [uncultured bacterium]